ncbi:MAG: matrixin family metalloprotease [Bdellovibrionota bacterium]
MVKVVLTALFFVAAQAKAFTLITTNPNQKGWASNEITFLVNTANCPIDVVSLIANAAAVWSDVANSNIKASYGGTTTSTAYANPTTVYCATNLNAVTGADEDFVPAAASVHTSDGVIYEGIIYLNASSGDANIANFDTNSLTITLAHEIGHILGLGHSADGNALMYFDGTYKNKLSLAQDDIDGVSYLYPSDEFRDGHFAGCGSVGQLPPPPPSNLLFLTLLMLLPVAVLARLRRDQPGLHCR